MKTKTKIEKEYTVVLKKKAEKFLDGLSEPNYSAVKTAILSLAYNPRPFGYIKLSGSDAYRIRVGNYRIIYDIFDEILTVEVVNIGHRKEIYKNSKL